LTEQRRKYEESSVSRNARASHSDFPATHIFIGRAMKKTLPATARSFERMFEAGRLLNRKSKFV